MAAGGVGGGGGDTTTITTRSLLETPSFALATVCFVFISLSLFLEHLIHLLSHWLKKSKKIALFEAVEKLKSVLMILGLMSLILTVTQRLIVKICIPEKAANTMLPCRNPTTKTTKNIQERILADEAAGASSDYCTSKGMTSLISQDGINQLSIFIFVLAVTQITYTILTMALGRAKMRRWKGWERETQTVEYQAANDPNRFRYTRETTFGRRHMSSSTRTTSFQLWLKCFFRQFFNSVAKVDYLTLRQGFIAAHLPNNTSFNFQNYIQRSLEDDFRAVVGISPIMWFLVVIFMLVGVHGWQMYLWVSFLPLIMLLILGTKLEVVVAEMALQLQDQNTVIKGALLVQPNDSLFWFGHPKFVLTLLHYTLFMNAFELAFFVWVTLQFGIKSCYHEDIDITLVRVVLAVTVQVVCSYITLPLYALVTQMGSQYKSAMLEEQVATVMKKWHDGVKKKKKKRVSRDLSPSNRSNPSSVSTSNRNQLPHSPSNRRTQIFMEMSMTSGENEIVEEGQEIDLVTSSDVQLDVDEMSNSGR